MSAAIGTPVAARRMPAGIGGRCRRATHTVTLWLGGFALAIGSGCAAVHHPPAATLAGPLPTAATLLQAVQQQRAARSGLRALARVTYEGPEDHAHARQVLLVERPARLRFEVLSPLGSVFVLTTDNGTLAAYVRGEATVYRGRASRTNLQRYARVGLRVADAVELLLGMPPPRPGQHEVVSFDPTSNSIELWRELPGGAQVIWFNPALQVVATEDRDGDGRVQWRARFGAFAGPPSDMPTHIAIELPEQGRRLALELSEAEVNPVLAPDLFTLATPPGVKEVQLDSVISRDDRMETGS